MQAIRSLAQNAGLLAAGKRSMTTAAQIAADASKGKGNLIDTIGVYTIAPLSVVVFIYDVFIHPEEEFEGQIPPYPYLRIRTRDSYPWGSDRGPFEVHQVIAPKE